MIYTPWPDDLAALLAPGPEHSAGWAMLFGPQRQQLGRLLAQPGHAGDTSLTALQAAWLLEVQRLPHESERLLRREPLPHAALRALLAAGAAQMYDDAPAALYWSEQALACFDDPLQPLHLWAQCTRGLALLECGEPQRALAPLQTALRGADRDGLQLLQLDALRVLARAHEELGDAPAAAASLAGGLRLAAARDHAALPASASLRRLQAQSALRQQLLLGEAGYASADEPSGEGFAERLLRAQRQWVAGDVPAARQAVALLEQDLVQRYCPLKWQLELGALRAALGPPPAAALLPREPGAPDTLYGLQAAVLDAGHARLAGSPWPSPQLDALAQRLQARQLRRLQARLALVRATDAAALDAWWQLPARDPLDALWLAACLLQPWQDLLLAPAPRRSAAQQQHLQRLWARLSEPAALAALPAEPAAPPPADLTPREWQVLQLIAQQWSNAQIADRLCVAEATIKTHINRLYAKLDLRNRAEAVQRARALTASRA